jgi:GAF domain-containing protein
LSVFLPLNTPAPGLRQAYLGVHQTGSSPLIRISAWVSAANRTRLRFVIGWPESLATTLSGVAVTVADGDPASLVFQNGQVVNYRILGNSQRPPDPLPTPATALTPATQTIFRGILIVPIYSGGLILGVLEVEREKTDRFDPPQVALAGALAALYGTALS